MDEMEQNEQQRLIQEIRELNKTMTGLLETQRSFKRRFVAGLVTGLGTVVGATVLVSLILWMLQPLLNVEFFRGLLEPVVESMERGPAKTPGR